MTQAAEQPSIANSLQPFVDRHELAGAVTLVLSKDKILSLEAVGYSDIAARKLMQKDALFWIASMSKPIAGTATMILVDEGSVTLDDPIEKYLPQFAPRIMAVTAEGAHVQLQRPRRAITIRDLLSHMSGIRFASPLETPTLDLLPLALGVESYALEPLDFEPGSSWSYSNAGINTAARVIEVVSGIGYDKFLQNKLFGPLGMKDTTFFPSEAQLSRLAKSYQVDDSGEGLQETPIAQLHYPLNDDVRRYSMPAGGLFSTASDLGEFCQMLLNGGSLAGRRYLSDAAIREMARDQVSAEVKRTTSPSVWRGGRGYGFGLMTGYGLGWVTKSGGVFGHAGAYSTDMNIDLLHGLATVWLVQHAGFPGDGGKSREVFERTVSRLFIATDNSNHPAVPLDTPSVSR